MTKYPVLYHSSSKGDVDIESMATPHLCNAWRKMRDGIDARPDDELIYVSMVQELAARGGALDKEDRWVFPAKEGA